MFEPIDFTNLNETDVREEIVAPLVRYLGYRSGTTNNVIREQSLRYPRAFLGRKIPRNDPLLRGKADYILVAQNTTRWVIEAKAPDVDIDFNAIEQAYTYANHPEIRAVYFSLSNGRRFVVYQTNKGPEQQPIFDVSYSELNTSLSQLMNLLGPDAILRDHPNIEPDTGTPLGPGLRSVVRIANGLIRYTDNTLGSSVLTEMLVGISEGAVERDEEGRMVAYLKTTGPCRSLHELNERLGLAAFEMVSDDKSISTDPSQPTKFTYKNTIVFPAGEKLIDLNTWTEFMMPINLSCKVTLVASGYLNGVVFVGIFKSDMNFLESKMAVSLNGDFKIHLA
ncbi:hypothetical protein [Methylomonas sp. CM2]|uniref:hypothetical protein n=1 Tax=Methylomonas sp. CM2 TaxID=3417647 RepID=UPI003CEBB358